MPKGNKLKEKGKTNDEKNICRHDKQARNIISSAYENAMNIAEKNKNAYIAWNPQDAERRNRDFQIEVCGINNLYYRILDELDRLERISRSANAEVANF